MVARLTTWLFYAVVFFFLGVWVGGFSPGLRALTREGAQAVESGLASLRHWADESIGHSSPPEQSPPAAAVDALQAARAAFARADVSEAIALYEDRLRQNPDDVDARGELGNVYVSAGRLQEAAETFYETALRLARNGDMARARALAPVIRRADSGLADKLTTELEAIEASRKPGAAPSPEPTSRRAVD